MQLHTPAPLALTTITQQRGMSLAEIAEEFDIVYVEVEGFLQPVPAEKLASILEVFPQPFVLADVGESRVEFAEIQVNFEDTGYNEIEEAPLADAVVRLLEHAEVYMPHSREQYAAAPINDSFDEMVNEPFQYWERASFTEPTCGCCNHRICIND